MYKQLEKCRAAKGRVRIGEYSRCSSDEQKKNGYTVSDQLDYIENFARENDLIVAGEYVDEGISATLEISKRKALAQLIKDAQAGKFDIIVFKCIDRFFRNTEEYYTAQKQLRKAGVTWISIEEPDLDPDDADAAFKINIYLAMAEYEARKTSKRIRFNNKMRTKNKQVVTGSQCFLFPWIVAGEKKNRHLERDLSQEERLFDILDHFELHQSKSATLAYHNSKYDDTMSYTTFTNLLTDTLLYGEYKGVPDYVEPWISKDRFDNIAAILKRNTRHSTKTSRTFLFSGLIKCPCCGNILAGNYHGFHGSSEIYHYRCNKNRQNKQCPNSGALNEKKIEAQLLDNLEIYVAKEIARVESIKEKNSQATDNSKKIAALQKEKQRLNTMFRKGRIEEEEYDAEFAVLESELKKLDTEEKPEERDLTALKKVIESDYRTIYESLDRPHRKAFWRKLIKEFTTTEDRQIIPDSIIFF